MKNTEFKIKNIEIREAREADFDGVADILFDIASIHHKGAPEIFKKPREKDPLVREDFLSTLANNEKKYFVAVFKNEVAGMVCVSIKEKRISHYVVPGRFGYINELGVKEESRHMGIGNALIGKALDWIKSQNDIQEVALNVRAFNKDAINFYKNLGFETVSYRMSRRINHDQ